MAASAAVCALSAASFAQAQTQAAHSVVSGEVATVGDVVVTAQKRKQNIQDVPGSVQAIGGEQLRDALITRASDVSRLVPNFSGDTAVGNVSPRWYLRGIGNSVPGNGQTSPLGVYQDEVYIGLPVAQAFPLFDLERVEVLSGPQGTLWGRNTTAGLVNFISRKPAFTSDGYGRAEYGNYGHVLLEGAWGGPVSDKIAVRGAVYFQDNDGYAVNQHDGTPVAKNSEEAVRFQVLAQPTDDFSALLKLQIRKSENVGDIAYEGYNAKDSAGYAVPASYKDNASYGESGLDLTHRTAQLNLDWKLGDLSLTSITAYNDFDHRSVVGTQTDHEGSHSYSLLNAEVFSQEFRLSSPETGRLKWILGGNYYHERLNSDSATVTLPNTVGLSVSYTDTQFKQTSDAFAILANASYDLTDRLKLSVGVRQTWESKKIDLNTLGSSGTNLAFADPSRFWLRDSVSGSSLVPNTAVQNEDRDWNATTYDVNLLYDLTGNARVYAKYARGFRSGGYNPGASTQNQVATVNPEFVDNYEIGLKSEWFDRRLTANLSAFYADYTDIQVTVIQLPLSQLSNAGSGYSKGVEATVSARPIPALRLGATLGLLDTEYKEFPKCRVVSGVSIDCSGNQFVRAPHVSASLSGDYTWNLANGGAIIADTNWSYRSHLYFNAGTQAAPLDQDPQWIGNASLSYRLPNQNVKFSVFARNVTDNITASTVIPSSAFGYIKYLAEPRVWGVSASVDF